MKKMYGFVDLNFEVTFTYGYTEQLCKDYEISDTTAPDVAITVTPEMIQYERDHDTEASSDAYLESLALCRAVSEAILSYDGFLFHASALAIDGDCYLFTAPSGTGKSTHTRLWRKVYGDRVTMVNDDKPFFRVFADGIYAYGTPWNGKHHLGTNTKAKIAGICLLERGEENTITPTTPWQAYPMLLNQTYRPDDKASMEKTLQLLNRLLEQVPIYKLSCNMDESAATTAYVGMTATNTINPR